MRVILPARSSAASRLFEWVIRFVAFFHERAALRLLRFRYETEIWQFIYVVASDARRARLALHGWRNGTLRGAGAAHCSLRTWCYREAWRQLWGARTLVRITDPVYRADAPDRAHRAWAQLGETSRMLVYLSKIFGFSEGTIATVVEGFLEGEEGDLDAQIRSARTCARAAWALEAPWIRRSAAPAPKGRRSDPPSWDTYLVWTFPRRSPSDEQSPSF